MSKLNSATHALVWILLVLAGTMAFSSPASLMLPRSAVALDNEDTDLGLGTDAGIIEQIISTAFEPLTLFVLQETSLGEVRQYEARQVEFAADKESEQQHLIVGAPVPVRKESLRENNFHFTFFLAGKDSAFAATEVKKWSNEELTENSVEPSDLRINIAELEQELKVKRVKAIDVQENLVALRERASKIAQVNDIVRMKMKLSGFQSKLEQKTAESLRLRSLVETGRDLQDPDDVDDYRQQLSHHLQEAAQVTALADRLNRRKREAALQDFSRKVNLVKDMDASDPKSLAQEILRLRKKRRELENRLGITSTDSFSDEF